MILQKKIIFLITYIIEPETVYKTVLYIGIPFFVLLIITLILLILSNRINFDKILRKKSKWNNAIDVLLTEILFNDLSTQEIKNKLEKFKIEKITKKKWFKNQMLYKLIDIKQNISNIEAYKIILIYRLFKLPDYSKKLIKKRKWYFKSLAIYHYQMLDYKIKKGYIKPLLQHKNASLRSNALLALITLTDEKLKVIENLNYPITKSDELKILDAVKNGKTEIPKNLDKWLKSENDSIVLLAIKLFILQNKSIPREHLKNLILNPNKNIRRQIIQAIRKLKILNVSDLLVSAFYEEKNIRNKISILKSLAVNGNFDTILFFQTILKDEKNTDIIFECIKSHHSIQKIEKIEKNFYENIDEALLNKIELHIKNPYLS